MPKHRPPQEVWQIIRRQVWERDGGLCQYPHGTHPVALNEAHIDHIVSGKLGTNALSNLRTLCRYHHVLRADHRHHGMIARALRDGIIRRAGGSWCGTGEEEAGNPPHQVLFSRSSSVLAFSNVPQTPLLDLRYAVHGKRQTLMCVH